MKWSMMALPRRSPQPSPRRTLSTIRLPIQTQHNARHEENFQAELRIINEECDTHAADGVVFSDGLSVSHGKNGAASAKSQDRQTTLSLRSRQDAQVHIVAAALLEHICALYESRPDRQKAMREELAARLSDHSLISPIAFMDVFGLMRSKYRDGLEDLIKATVTMIDKDPLRNKALLAPTVTDLDLQVSRLIKPQLPYLIRTASDPRREFFSSRYADDFSEIAPIGKGGFGSVYKVRNKLDDVFYAVKRIRLKQLSPEKCSKILREVKLLATLHHPSVVRYNSAWLEKETAVRITEVTEEDFSDSSEDDVSQSLPDPFMGYRMMLYIQMELCDCNMHDWLEQRNDKLYKAHPAKDVCKHLSEAENVNFIRQLLNGLDYIHGRGVIHRDIKTRNIFIDSNRALKIGDFGLARDVVATPSPSELITSKWDFTDVPQEDILSKGVGTSIYTSPEQQCGTCYDSRTDMYSAGIIIYELFCPCVTEMERYDRIKQLREKHQVSEQLLSLYANMMEMVLRMVETNPVRRPSARELLTSYNYVNADQVIAHLEARVEELESRCESLAKENELLRQTMRIDSKACAQSLACSGLQNV